VSLVSVLVNRLWGWWHPESQREIRRQALRARLIARWTSLLADRKGAFTKAGQFASLRLDVLPADVASALAMLRDNVPPIPFEAVQAVIESDLGAPLERCFEKVDREAIGAASIAQAHRARLQDGSEVIVKVQYPWIQSSIRADLRWLRILVVLGLGLRGTRTKLLDWPRFFSEFESSLREELDFRIEARAALEIAQNLGDDEQVRVPRVIDSHSGQRVLTVYYHPCVNISDREGLARLGISPRAILEILARAYAKQIFVDGLFHADPHSGNLFVLDEPDAAEHPCVLFVDFGLHRRLSDELRRSLRHGIYALLQKDLDEFINRMNELDMISTSAQATVRSAVKQMFDQIDEKPDSGSPLAISGNRVLDLKDEAKILLQNTPGLQLPNDLLLYARTLSYLFALGEELDPEVDLMKISTPYLLRFLAERD
jgi:ubiquinone biosynthesis protein